METRFGATDAWLRADLDKLSQVIRNLLQNALQYTEPGGTVRISMEPTHGEIKVIFANTGGELSEKDLPFIFERFYRGEKSRSREHGGAGIGLAIVKELIEAHNGSVGQTFPRAKRTCGFPYPFESYPLGSLPNLYVSFIAALTSVHIFCSRDDYPDGKGRSDDLGIARHA